MDDDTAHGGVLEPVHWGSRLVRSDRYRYTEVDGTPVLVAPDDGDVRVLTPTWAGIWAQLDGRVVSGSLAVEPGTLDPVDARNLLEVLRRLKADGVVVDAPRSSEPAPGAGRDPARQVDLDGRVDVTVAGIVSVADGHTVVRIDPNVSRVTTVRIVSSPSGPAVSVRRRWRRRRVDRVEIAGTTAAVPPDTSVDRFVAIVRALDDREVLFRPGLVDLLAELAEHAVAPGSPGR